MFCVRVSATATLPALVLGAPLAEHVRQRGQFGDNQGLGAGRKEEGGGARQVRLVPPLAGILQSSAASPSLAE